MFLFSPSYTDVATLSTSYAVPHVREFVYSGLLLSTHAGHLPHYTSGQTYFYPAFSAARSEDAIKFAHEFGEVLASPIGLEAVIRVRATRGAWLHCDWVLINYLLNIYINKAFA